MNSIVTLDRKMMIPDLLQTSPQVRAVLDRYGLRGRGGPLGPCESLEFFAQAHEVPIDQLLGEIQGQLAHAKPAAEPEALTSRPANTIYRPFFKAGIVVVLTLGAVWGAYLLLRIGWQGAFGAVGLHEVNAHGHAQIFGWVGLFVMGFAYQAFPRFKHTDLAWPNLAFSSLWLMLIGLVGRSVAEPLAGDASWLQSLAVACSVAEIVAIGLFLAVIAATWKRSGKPLACYDYYIASALGWFFLQAICETLYLAASLGTASRQELLDLVATWQGPLREIQIHGFALLMILGVSQRLFHHFYGFPAPEPRLSRRVLLALNLAIVGEVTGLILMRTMSHAFAALWYLSVLVLVGGVALLVRSWHIFSRPTERDRSLKFLRAAYIWLFLSLGMLSLLPLHQQVLLPWLAPQSAAAHSGFSHAYYGAIRHAITVGFISLMIVGVAAKVVPTLNGVDVRGLSRLWGPFVLINGGCALRVFGQALTDAWPQAFPITAASGVLEVCGLALWGLHLWAIMTGRARWHGPAESEGDSVVVPGSPIVAEHRVGAVLETYPEMLPIFLSFGFKPLQSATLRKTLARHITIASACRFLGIGQATLLEALNRERAQRNKISLPLVDVVENSIDRSAAVG